MKQLKLIQSNTIFLTFKYFTKGQLSFLRKKGFHVHAICSDHEEANEFFQKEKTVFHPIRINRDISLYSDFYALIKIIFYIARVKPDIVQGSTPKAGLLTLLAACFCRTPVRIFFMRGVRSSGLSGTKKIIVEFMEKSTCQLSHQVLCTSESVRKEIVNKNICPANKAKVLNRGTGNGIDTNRFNADNFSEEKKEELLRKLGIKKNNRVLMFSGRLVKDKGLVELFNAWEILKIEFPDLVLLLLGKEETIDPLPSAIFQKLNSDPRVKMLGFVEDCAPYYAISTVFTLPSYREGLPISVLEASSMKLPVVTTRVTGCVDAVIDNHTGKIIKAKNYNALIKGISFYLSNSELRKQHGENGRKMVMKYFKSEVIWNSLYETYSKLYADLD